MPDRPLRVVLADDDTEFLQSLATALAAYDWIDVVGIAGDGGEAERLYAGLAPDVLVMDLLMAGSNGVEATRRIVRADPDAHVVILTASSDERALTLCMRAGARACLRKDPLTPRMLPLMLTLTRLQALPAARERKPGKDDARATAPDTGRSRAVTSHVKMRLLGLACVTLAVGLAGCGDDVMSGEAAVAHRRGVGGPHARIKATLEPDGAAPTSGRSATTRRGSKTSNWGARPRNSSAGFRLDICPIHVMFSEMSGR